MGRALSGLRINIAEEGEPGDKTRFRTDASKSVLIDDDRSEEVSIPFQMNWAHTVCGSSVEYQGQHQGRSSSTKCGRATG